MLIAQITDLHVRSAGERAYGMVDTNAMLRACVASLLRLTPLPDVVIASGDLTDCGLPAEYESLRKILAQLPMPLYIIPGNHDRRENMLRAFDDHTYLRDCERFAHYVVDDYPLALIGLDSVVAGKTHGQMCPERLAWLDARLDERKHKPVIIFMHHPPFLTGLAGMDRINCRNGDAMAHIVRRYPNIERVLAGHHHRPVQLRWAGTMASVAPSTAHQISLDLTPDGRCQTFIMEPPAYHLHQWTQDVGVITHQAYVGPYDGPYPVALDSNSPGSH